MRYLRLYDDLGPSVDRWEVGAGAIQGVPRVSLGQVGTHADLEARDGYVSVSLVEQETSDGSIEFEATFIGGPGGLPPKTLALFVGREPVATFISPDGIGPNDLYAWAVRHAVTAMSGHVGDD